jgi:hypothetical protein
VLHVVCVEEIRTHAELYYSQQKLEEEEEEEAIL